MSPQAVLICSDLLTVLQPPLLSISPKARPNFLTTNIVRRLLTVKMALRLEVASDSLHAITDCRLFSDVTDNEVARTRSQVIAILRSVNLGAFFFATLHSCQEPENVGGASPGF